MQHGPFPKDTGRQSESMPKGREEERDQALATIAALRSEIERLRDSLHDERARYRALSESLRDIVFAIDARGGLLSVRGNTMGILGIDPTDAQRRAPSQWLALVHGEDRGLAKDLCRRAIEAQSPEMGTLRVRDIAGEYRWVAVSLQPRFDDEGAFAGLHGLAWDVTDRVRSERFIASLNRAAEAVQSVGLSQSEILRAVTEQLAGSFTTAVLLLDDVSGDLVWAHIARHDSIVTTLGRLAQGQLIGRRVDPRDIDILKQCLADHRARCVPLTPDLVSRLLGRAGERLSSGRVAELSSRDLILAPMVAEGRPRGVLLALGNRIRQESLPPVAAFANQAALALLNAELVQSLQESEERYRNIFDSVTDGLTIFDPSGCIIDANPAACDLYGYSHDELVGMHLSKIVHPDYYHDLTNFSRGIAEEGFFRAQSVNVRKDGSLIDVEIKGTAVTHQDKQYFLSVDTDITERLRSQKALLRSETLSALGQMAGGVAHDFNNLLLAIRGFCSLALLEMEEAPDMARADLERALASTADAAESVRRLQSLYRDAEDTSDFTVVRLDQILQEAIELTEPRWKDEQELHGNAVEIITDVTAPAQVLGNASELRRVVSNLVLNAIDAMPDGGTLRLSTGAEEGFCCVIVADTGVGMGPEVRSQIFGPFFTTKGDAGTGLGLAVSLNIVERHGGRIDVESQVGVGTTFTVWLPRFEGQETAIESSREPSTPAQSETPALRVLVVDDEAPIRNVLVRYLERNGHSVISADSGTEAIARLREGRFDLLVTDLGMPDVSGYRVAQAARDLCPAMPVIIATGWGETISPDRVRSLGATTVLSKPYSLDDLQRAIQVALKDRESADPSI